MYIFLSNTGSTENIWIYIQNEWNKYTRINNIKFEDLDDFLNLLKSKPTPEKSWILNINEIYEGFNLFKININRPPYGILSEPKADIDRLIANNDKTIDQLADLKDIILKLEKAISTSLEKYTFSKFKVVDIITLKNGVLLQKCKLLDRSNYPVYGGNGFIGYYNDSKESEETIVIGKVGALCGNVRYLKGNIWVTNNAFVMKNTAQDRIYTPYLAKVLSMKNLRELATGTAQ